MAKTPKQVSKFSHVSISHGKSAWQEIINLNITVKITMKENCVINKSKECGIAVNSRINTVVPSEYQGMPIRALKESSWVANNVSTSPK